MLRPDQIRVIAAVRDHYRSGARSVVLQSPTGFGKTFVAAALIRRSLEKGNRCVFVAHRDDLIGVTVDRLRAAGIHTGRVQASEIQDAAAPVQVCSVQTLHARSFAPPANFVLLDEAHRVRAKTWESVIARWPEAKILGLTATPERADGRGLRTIFDRLVQGPSIQELQKIGALVPVKCVSPIAGGKLRGLAIDPIEALDKWSEGRPTIAFCRSVEEARELARRIGPDAACVDGETPQDLRRDALDAFVSGRLRVITNCLVLTEGFDAPRAEVCLLARGATHVGTYLQIVGRVMRPSPGKSSATLIDLRGLVHIHGFPDEDRKFSLDGIERDPTAVVCSCSACGAAYPPPKFPCPRCGYNPAPTPIEQPPVENVPMAHFERSSVAGDFRARRAHFDHLVEEARARCYKPGWVGMRFKERWGYWPTWRING